MKHTSLHEEHIKLGAKMVYFSGWEMPINYPAGILTEHLTTRKFGGLFDISHMGRFWISGGDALPFLQYTLTNNVAALLPGESQYTIIPNETGGSVDDAYLYRIDENEYILVVNAANRARDWEWFRKYWPKFPGLLFEDYSTKLAMISLQGPRTKAVLERIVGDVWKLPEPIRNSVLVAEIMGTKVPISRTGYTGEPIGFELFPPTEIAPRLWNRLLEIGREVGISPVGLGARDTLRLEAGLPLYGHELGTDEEGKEIPIFALPLAKYAVSFGDVKGEYVGREALTKQFTEVKLRKEGLLDSPETELLVPKMIMPMTLLDGGIARPGCQVYVGEKHTGTVTSGTMVPYWKMAGTGGEVKPGTESGKRAICLAYLDADLDVKQRTKVIIRDKVIQGIIVDRHLGSEAAPYAQPIFVEKQIGPIVGKPPESLKNLAVNLVHKACENTEWRQRSTINLIPSEQTPSTLVRLLSITDPSGRYAEHTRIGALGDVEVYYYQGTKFIYRVELELVEKLKELLNCSEVETRVISGQMANITVFSGLMDYLNRTYRKAEPRRLRSVMNHNIRRGGHLSSQVMGGLRDYVAVNPVTERRAVVHFPVKADNPYTIDLARTGELIEEHKPELIVFGKSMMLYREPVREVTKMIAGIRPKPVTIYDGAHVMGLLGPNFQKPLEEGADMITGSVHKTFFGTQRGIIASNMSEGTEYYDLWQSITKRAFPGAVSNHHLGTLLGLLMAAYEMNAYASEYSKQVIANAKAFARALEDQGLQVEGDPKLDYTETHQVVLRVGYAKGLEIAERLERNNIIVNYQGLPDDEGFTSASGVRMGVQEMTRFGMKGMDFEELAVYIAEVILRDMDVAQEISRFRDKFDEMKYCLPQEQAQPMVDRLLASLV